MPPVDDAPQFNLSPLGWLDLHRIRLFSIVHVPRAWIPKDHAPAPTVPLIGIPSVQKPRFLALDLVLLVRNEESM